ncbi:DUF3310 domain-containing protein [Staphylococcus felis]|uniref:DUF3310 domain-containing protein n=1 Tax=Staphylococcus felis TaxID=46127 RepID=UPI000E26A85B|nr:DUF3310 domain-containing protein [Staphylococcus felis]REI04047.1 DUF3310 domain-containing protein [Staphylococcus felis]REI10990.1 DUF3310 domain-containing protein [Staphylococcus felis]REI32742.1 DUF3310 domain-containing protein [Staphylococcus felis]
MSKIKDLKIGQKINLVYGTHRIKDADDEKWILEPLETIVEVIEVDYIEETAVVKFKNSQTMIIDDDNEFETLPISKKIDYVNKPPHYIYGEIEVIDYIEQVIKDYPPQLAFAIGNAIKYISRATRKNGKEDLAKARWYLERAYEKWEVTSND